jgi:hypothetical protein
MKRWSNRSRVYLNAQNRAAHRISKTLLLRTNGVMRGVDGDLTEVEHLCLDGQSATLCNDKCYVEEA